LSTAACDHDLKANPLANPDFGGGGVGTGSVPPGPDNANVVEANADFGEGGVGTGSVPPGPASANVVDTNPDFGGVGVGTGSVPPGPAKAMAEVESMPARKVRETIFFM
jgi:hypothetical protein